MSRMGRERSLGTLLVPTDFSEGAAFALERALLLPLGPSARIHVLHVLPHELPEKLRAKAESEARARLDRVLARARASKAAADADVTSEIRRGRPFVEIIRTSRSLGVDLIVLGRHGRRPVRDMFIGTTAQRVVRKGDVPVLVVNLEPTHPYHRPLIALDLEDSSRRVVDLALRVIGRDVKVVEAVHAFHVPFEGFVTPTYSARDRSEWRRSYQETALTRLTTLLTPYRNIGVRWKTLVRQGDPRSVVLAAAARRKADVIVVGSHGRSGIAHALLGSVAEWIITAATCDVLVARAQISLLELV